MYIVLPMCWPSGATSSYTSGGGDCLRGERIDTKCWNAPPPTSLRPVYPFFFVVPLPCKELINVNITAIHSDPCKQNKWVYNFRYDDVGKDTHKKCFFLVVELLRGVRGKTPWTTKKKTNNWFFYDLKIDLNLMKRNIHELQVCAYMRIYSHIFAIIYFEYTQIYIANTAFIMA